VPGVLGGVAAGAGCGAEKPFGDAMLSDPIKRGFYLAIIVHCMDTRGDMQRANLSGVTIHKVVLPKWSPPSGARGKFFAVNKSRHNALD
jgi:hypothetical protein